MRWNSKGVFPLPSSRLSGKTPESVIQDVDIPVARAPEFLAFFLEEVGILPVWICPIGGCDTQRGIPLFPVHPHIPYLKFCFLGPCPGTGKTQPGRCNHEL